MAIQDFYSKLASQNEKNSLYEALRRLSLLPDLKGLQAEDPSAGALGSWGPWQCDAPCRQASAKA